MTGGGGLIVKLTGFEVPPPGAGFTTVTDAVPTAATFAAGTIAVSLIEETNVVARAEPFQLTVEVETKLVPFTVRVNEPLPAMVEVGLIEVMVGTGLLMLKVTEFEVPPPGAGLTTVTDAVPAVATLAAGTVAVSCVEETNVVVRAEPFQSTVEVETKLVPFTVKVNEPLPAVVEVGLIEVIVGTGLLMVKVTEFEVPPPGAGFTTVTDAVPPVATLAAGMVAVSLIEETNVVVRAEPFQLTVEVETKLVPFTVKVNEPLPAVVEVGLIEVMVGTGLLMLKVTAFDVPPPGAGFTTVTDAVPALAIRAAGTVAVSCVALTNVVVSAVPFQFTVEPETKLVPFTVNVNCAPPAVAEVGLIEVIVGTGLLMVMTSVAVPVPPALVALIVTLYTPPTVGVPEISPVLVFTLRPGGSGVAL
jgi:hypothetical protein